MVGWNYLPFGQFLLQSNYNFVTDLCDLMGSSLEHEGCDGKRERWGSTLQQLEMLDAANSAPSMWYNVCKARLRRPLNKRKLVYGRQNAREKGEQSCSISTLLQIYLQL